MPYIRDKIKRNCIEDVIDEHLVHLIESKGDLNFTITYLLHIWIMRRGGIVYDNIADVEGTLDCVAREFYRTVAAPYEDEKRAANGSVSRLDRVKDVPFSGRPCKIGSPHNEM